MTDADPAKRPMRATVGAWVVIAGSALLVLTSYDGLGRLHSVDTRKALADGLRTTYAGDVPLSVDQALGVMHVGLVVSAVCGAIALVFGVFVLRGHALSRIGLSVVSVPILGAALLGGGVGSIAVAAGAAMLWTGPVRDWYAGRAPSPDPAAQMLSRQLLGRRDPDARDHPSARDAGGDGPDDRDGPGDPDDPDDRDTGSAQRPAPPATGAAAALPAPDPGTRVQAPTAPASVRAPAPGRPAVDTRGRVAAVITWLFAGTAALLYLGIAIAMVVTPDPLIARIRANPVVRGYSAETLRWLLVGFALVFLMWCLGAIVLAVLVWRGQTWARYLLLASALVALVLGFLSFPIGLPHQLACLVCAAMLLRPPPRTRPRTPPGTPPGPHGGPYGAPPPPPPADPSGRPGPW